MSEFDTVGKGFFLHTYFTSTAYGPTYLLTRLTHGESIYRYPLVCEVCPFSASKNIKELYFTWVSIIDRQNVSHELVSVTSQIALVRLRFMQDWTQDDCARSRSCNKKRKKIAFFISPASSLFVVTYLCSKMLSLLRFLLLLGLTAAQTIVNVTTLEAEAFKNGIDNGDCELLLFGLDEWIEECSVMGVSSRSHCCIPI